MNHTANITNIPRSYLPKEYKLTDWTSLEPFLKELLDSLYKNNIQSVLVEGGAKTLQSFIDSGLGDEARIITNETMVVEGGIDAPQIKDFSLVHLEKYFTDSITYFKRK